MDDLPPPHRFMPVTAVFDANCPDDAIIAQMGDGSEAFSPVVLAIDMELVEIDFNIEFPLGPQSDVVIIANLINAYRTGKLVPAEK